MSIWVICWGLMRIWTQIDRFIVGLECQPVHISIAARLRRVQILANDKAGHVINASREARRTGACRLAVPLPNQLHWLYFWASFV